MLAGWEEWLLYRYYIMVVFIVVLLFLLVMTLFCSISYDYFLVLFFLVVGIHHGVVFLSFSHIHFCRFTVTYFELLSCPFIPCLLFVAFGLAHHYLSTS
ncbi:hypothetical protein BJ508DRAFT_120403 [Ascobolus immersus RN42]|uniref:Uncharacterized protein n=1 Tax=Ascobolus immersus RN42 TaxID=1160509 RepID=A0A3N4IKX4_ASCIM|nr:hypothetical protein BJ508DRAFT_120403 [Ascobolus immersus RN42]